MTAVAAPPARTVETQLLQTPVAIHKAIQETVVGSLTFLQRSGRRLAVARETLVFDDGQDIPKSFGAISVAQYYTGKALLHVTSVHVTPRVGKSVTFYINSRVATCDIMILCPVGIRSINFGGPHTDKQAMANAALSSFKSKVYLSSGCVL